MAEENLQRIYPCIEVFDGGNHGYRIWSDGYCEQWGTATAEYSGAWGIIPVTLMKVMRDSNYCVVHGHQHRNYQVNTYEHLTIYGLTKTGFVLNPYNYIGESLHFWRVCGYLEEGQY
jgi:hypothetical protein